MSLRLSQGRYGKKFTMSTKLIFRTQGLRNMRSKRGWLVRKAERLSEKGDRRIQRANVEEAGERGRRQQGKFEPAINQEYRKHWQRGAIIDFSVFRL
jgi:hypothetical protein